MRQVLINADDLNYTPGINKAIGDLFEKGAISTTTAMMALARPHIPAPGFLSKWRRKVGLHLQLSQGRPRTPLRRTDGRIVQAFPGRDDVAGFDPISVAREWDEQLRLFRSIFTNPPCRIDSHHGVHNLDAYAPIASSMAENLGRPMRGPEDAPDTVQAWTGQFLKAEALAEMIRGAAEKADHATVIEVITHPGLDNHQLRNIDSWQECRENDYRELIRLKEEWTTMLPGFELV